MPIGTRLIASTPPAMATDSQPERILAAVRLTASSADAQNRLIVTPAPAASGRPEAIAAVRAMFAPWSPTGVTHPTTMSSTSRGSSPGLRSRISWMRSVSMVTGLTPCRAPFLPLPRGVRIAS